MEKFQIYCFFAFFFTVRSKFNRYKKFDDSFPACYVQINENLPATAIAGRFPQPGAACSNTANRARSARRFSEESRISRYRYSIKRGHARQGKALNFAHFRWIFSNFGEDRWLRITGDLCYTHRKTNSLKRGIISCIRLLHGFWMVTSRFNT